jgi:hypothetical protein
VLVAALMEIPIPGARWCWACSCHIHGEKLGVKFMVCHIRCKKVSGGGGA